MDGFWSLDRWVSGLLYVEGSFKETRSVLCLGLLKDPCEQDLCRILRRDKEFTDVTLVTEINKYTKCKQNKFIVLISKAVQMATPSVPPHGLNIRNVKDMETDMYMDIMENDDFKTQIEALEVAGRGLGSSLRIQSPADSSPEED